MLKYALCKTQHWTERADHLYSPQWSSLMSVGVPLYSLPAEFHLVGTFPHPCKGICFRMLTVQGLQRSIWAVWTSGKLPKSLRSPSIPQESWKRAAAKHMSLSHEPGDQYHTTAAVHSSLWPANSRFSLSPSLIFSPVVPPFQGSHILCKAQSEFVCGAYRGQCNHRGLSAVQMFRVSLLNSMPSFSVVL